MENFDVLFLISPYMTKKVSSEATPWPSMFPTPLIFCPSNYASLVSAGVGPGFYKTVHSMEKSKSELWPEPEPDTFNLYQTCAGSFINFVCRRMGQTYSEYYSALCSNNISSQFLPTPGRGKYFVKKAKVSQHSIFRGS